MKVSKTGYKKNSKDKNQPSLLIPSNQITMKGVEFPVLGTDNTGYSQMMYPGLDYSFPGSYVYELPMAQGGGHIVPGRYRNPEGNWLNKYDNGGPRIDKLPIQQVDGKVEIAYDGSTVYIRKIGDEKFTSLSPDKSKAFLQKYQGFIPPTLTQVEEQKKKQEAYNAKIAKEKKEFDELRKIDTTPNPDEITNGYPANAVASTLVIQTQRSATGAYPDFTSNSFNSGLAALSISGTRLINASRQVQCVFRVITRELDSQSRLRPDNL